MTLVKLVYEATERFPAREMYGLTSQVRRCAVSIPSNIAEGAGRTGVREFARFLSNSRGSLAELETQLLIAAELGYIAANDDIFVVLERTSQLLTGLRRHLSRSSLANS
jgi:four helix bundle protein